MTTILVADSSETFAGTIATLAASTDAEVRRVDASESVPVPPDDPAVVVIGPSVNAARAFEIARSASDTGRCTGIVMVVEEITTSLMRDAMRAGVADVVAASDPALEIGRAVIETFKAAESRRAERPHEEAPARKKGGRVVTVFSTKGGVGKTVLSTNLGAALASQLGLKTAIVDLDLQFGDVGIMLGITPERTITDAVTHMDRLDADLLRGYMSSHSSGLDVLLAPTRPEEAEAITTGRITRILDLLTQMYDIVVVDTAATFDEVVLAALDRSDAVYAVTMMDVASIKNTRISLQKLKQLGYDDGLMNLVLNRADSKVWLQPVEVEKAVGASIFAKIPSDRVVPRSVNKGTPVVLDEPRSDVSKAIVGIAKGIAGSAQEVAEDVA